MLMAMLLMTQLMAMLLMPGRLRQVALQCWWLAWVHRAQRT